MPQEIHCDKKCIFSDAVIHISQASFDFIYLESYLSLQIYDSQGNRMKF